METREFSVSAPGRICLFGEHQDYLGLPVIAAAIERRLTIRVVLDDARTNRYRINLPDLNSEDRIATDKPIAFKHEKDYLRSAVKLLRSEGIELPRALTATVSSQIPIAAGTASSSALCVAWVAALLHAAGHRDADDPLAIARYAHKAEVVAFDEPGGMMDQLSISYGGVCCFDFEKSDPMAVLSATPEGLVLGDSCQPKDTQAVLLRVRSLTEGAIERVKSTMPAFDLRTTSLEEAKQADLTGLTGAQRAALFCNLRNRDLLREARRLLSGGSCDTSRLGTLLNVHHEGLRDALGVSTPKIEALLAAALGAGALGGKINGSGGGGCFFVLAPGRQAEVVKAVQDAGGRAWPVVVAQGIRIES